MKTKKLIILSLMILIILFLTSCEKDPISPEKFIKVCKEKGYTIKTESFNDGTIAYIASKSKTNNILFLTHNIDGNNEAKMKYEEIKKIINKDESNGITEFIELINYEKFSTYNDKFFKFISRVGNTIIVVDVPMADSESVMEVIEELKY